MTQLHITVRAVGGVTVIALAGELDLTVSGQVDDAVRAAQQDADHPHLVLDLSHLRFMDSAGLTVTMQAYRRAAANRTYFALTGLSPGTRRVLEISGLDGYFTIHPTLAEALTAAPDGAASLP
ncbi:STAS domain-containing protein [Actinomadura macrotermitis]|uniref:Anti-sigma factor antagonist n=1 Tax=Actinomadura macrotermitis TaxID=2585200 RepID=A0A7K0BPM7_9ACTN|nr:STAS domain-containing protein [Actinomadura macrotermitis]MQY02822.1 putative anti-sigma factor antagonist [Actinomadura macrotermitis]